MQFLIIGMDGTDEGALDRRMTVREARIALGEELRQAGNMWYGAAIQDDDGRMIGSALFMDFASEQELDEWLAIEPYVTGNVWQSVTTHKCSTRDPWQFNRPQEWFEARARESGT